jgi:hypothetical protein
MTKVIDESKRPGMTPKPRDPTADLMIRTFIARHGLRLVGFFPQVRASRFYCDGRTSQGPRPLGSQNGLTRIPPRATVTGAGKRYVLEMSDDRMVGEADYRAHKKGLSLAAAHDLSLQGSLGMSLAEGKHSRLSWDPDEKVYRHAIPQAHKLPEEGILPERHCQNPECLKGIDEKKHHNIEYCGAKCRERAKELRRRHKVSQAGQPLLYRNESDPSADLTNDINQLQKGLIGPRISIGLVSKVEAAVYQQ